MDEKSPTVIGDKTSTATSREELHGKAHHSSKSGTSYPHEVKVTLQPPAHEESAFSVRTVANTIMSQMRIIILMFTLFLILGIGAAFAYINFTRTHTGVAGAVILFGFPQAEQGLDPLGSRLDVNRIRSPYVIGNALDNLELRERGISAESIRANLVLRGVVPFDAIHQLMRIHDIAARVPMRLEEVEGVIYHPTMFALQLYRRGALESLNEQEINELLNEIIFQYKEYFHRTYSDVYFLDVVVTHFDPLEYDYFELITILNGTLGNMISYTESRFNVAPDFRSPNTQMTFGDIRANLNLIRDVDVTRIAALVHTNNMSRDRTRSANILEYQVIRMEMERTRNQANADDALFLADLYTRDTFVYHHGGERFFYERGSQTYSNFLQSAFNYKREVNRLDVEIEFYQNRVNSLRSIPNPANPNDVIFVEEAIPTILESLKNWENIINQTVQDYLTIELFGDAVRILSPSRFSNSMAAYRQQMILIVLVAAAAGAFLGAMIALYKGERRLSRS